MTRILLLLAAAISLSGVVIAKPRMHADQATIDALARTYSFGATETAVEGCQVTLKRGAAVRKAGRYVRPVEITSACRSSSLRGVTHWAAIGGASVALFGGDPLQESADFSPVQDATGVYLRGGFEGDAKIYEMRPLAE